MFSEFPFEHTAVTSELMDGDLAVFSRCVVMLARLTVVGNDRFDLGRFADVESIVEGLFGFSRIDRGECRRAGTDTLKRKCLFAFGTGEYVGASWGEEAEMLIEFVVNHGSPPSSSGDGQVREERVTSREHVPTVKAVKQLTPLPVLLAQLTSAVPLGRTVLQATPEGSSCRKLICGVVMRLAQQSLSVNAGQ